MSMSGVRSVIKILITINFYRLRQTRPSSVKQPFLSLNYTPIASCGAFGVFCFKFQEPL